MANVEAHITGTVWKIEVEVGDTVEEGDTVVILESMKMEMPVEAEDEGARLRDPVPGGSVGVRGRRPRRPRVSTEALADGKLAGTLRAGILVAALGLAALGTPHSLAEARLRHAVQFAAQWFDF